MKENDPKTPPLIDSAAITRIARLARLAPDEAEQALMQQELGQIIGYFRRLEQLDTDGVLPAYHPHQLENQLRDDTAVAPASREELLALSGRQKDGCLVAPRTVE